MARSFVPTSILDLMAALRAPALLPSSLQMMRATPSSNSMATTGKAVCWRSARIALLALDLALEAVEASAAAGGLAEASVVVAADLEVAVVSVAVSVAVAATGVAATEGARPVVLMRAVLLLPLILSPILQLLERREARRFMSAT